MVPEACSKIAVVGLLRGRFRLRNRMGVATPFQVRVKGMKEVPCQDYVCFTSS